MNHLYINPKGFPVTLHSYSAGETFRFCAQKYKLEKIDGWKSKDIFASTIFGDAVEKAVIFHHQNNLSGGPEEFARLWKNAEKMNLVYSDGESWVDLLNSGTEMLKLYHLKLPKMPFLTKPVPRFSISYRKEVFPDTDLAGIEFIAYIDMLAETANGEKIILDIKATSQKMDFIPDIAALDPQLRAYSWITGIEKVGFIWFTKTSRTIKKGYTVTLLEDFEGLSAGIEAEIRSVKKDFVDSVELETGVFVPVSLVTKQKLNVITARINEENRQEAAEVIAQDIVRIVEANERNFWPKQGGIRYPNSKCLSCPMRGNCLNNPKLRDQLVKRDDDIWSQICRKE